MPDLHYSLLDPFSVPSAFAILLLYPRGTAGVGDVVVSSASGTLAPFDS